MSFNSWQFPANNSKPAEHLAIFRCDSIRSKTSKNSSTVGEEEN